MTSATQPMMQTAPESVSNGPISLDQPGMAWKVEAGHVDIFMARIRASGEPGARTHVARVEAGGAVFGIDASAVTGRWMAIAQPGAEARMARMQRDALADPHASLESWTLCLSKAAMDGQEPKECHLIETGGTVELPMEPLPVSGKEPVVWVRHVRGEAKLFGKAELVLNGEYSFPLARPAWMEEEPRNVVETASTEQAVASGQAWSGLDVFHSVIFQALVRDREGAELKERARIAKRRDEDEARVDQSMRRLMAPLSGSGESEPMSGVRHPLVRACEAIGRVQHITFVPPAEVLRGMPMRDPVRAICRSSGVRARRVALEESWYREEGMPLLAFRESDEQPLALLPRGNRYYLWDPVEGTQTKVTEALAATLQPFAYAFYRPFHPRPVTLKYLCLFGLSGAWRETILVLALGLIGGAMGMVMPLLTANVFDTIIPGAQRQRMLETALFLLAATLASTMLNLTRDFTFVRIETKVESKVQAAIFDRLLSLPARFFRSYSSGELAERSEAIGSIRKMLTGSAMSALFSGIFSVFNFFLLFRFSLYLAFAALVLTAIQVLALVICGFFYLRVQRRIIAAQIRVSGLMLQLIRGIAKFRVSGTERRAFSAWSGAASEIWSESIRSSRIANALGVFNAAFSLITSIGIYFLTGALMSQPEGLKLSTGSFIAFGAAYGTFSGSFIQLAQVAIGLLAAVPVYQSAKPILEAIPETDPSKPMAGDLTGKIEISRVTFRYREDGPPILKDISVSITPGQFVAFVGASGSGKSTIFRILLGFEKPESGTVFFDGQDISTLDIASIRQQMGVVLQNSTVFSGDMFQNIVCSAPYTLDQAWEAARMAGFEQDLKNMPMGMHTIVGDGGAGLSGGQRQRLMIARAIVGKPRILMFDEATSALDNHTQAIVSRSLEGLRSTRVVIAHRLTTVMKADRIFVVDKGAIVQSGTYEELMAQPGPFTELAKRQLT
jgi:NHLM bacteriocin system ABC transporter ATP-binding protein